VKLAPELAPIYRGMCMGGKRPVGSRGFAMSGPMGQQCPSPLHSLAQMCNAHLPCSKWHCKLRHYL